MEEARKQAEKLTQEAGSNAVKKLAAQKAGELLVAEAEKQSKALVTKATEEGDRLVEKARSGTDQE